MAEVFADWKKQRFVTVGYELLDGPEMMVILTDMSYWYEHYNELGAWCDQHNAVMSGMTVTFPDEKTLMVFSLKWS